MHPAESEADFTTWVLDLAHLWGWACVHFRPAQTSQGWRTSIEAEGEGWPDWILSRPPRLIIAELKGVRGHLTAEQADWLERLKEVPGLEVWAWWPQDRELIERVLRR